MDDVINARLRVVSCAIAGGLSAGSQAAEVVQVKAVGEWAPETIAPAILYPISLHLTVYPGCGAIPVIGDEIRIAISRHQ